MNSNYYGDSVCGHNYSRTRLVRTRDTTHFGLVHTHFSEPEFIHYIDFYAISTRLVRTCGWYYLEF